MSDIWKRRSFDSPAGRVIAHLDEHGDRHVLLLHGNSSCMEAFIHQIEPLRSAGFAILAPDLPGHGRSENAINPETTYSFPGYATAIRATIDAVGWTTYTVLGWSLGGHVGLELLARDRRVNGLMIVGTPPIAMEAAALTEAFYGTSDMALATKAEFTDEDADTYLRQMLGCQGELPANLRSAARRTDGRARAWILANGLAGVGTDARRLVAHCERPLAIVHGATEPFVRLSYLAALPYRNLWRNSIQIFADDGHAPHWTNPGAFNALLVDFLNEAHEDERNRKHS